MKRYTPKFKRGLNRNIAQTLEAGLRTGTAQFNPAFLVVQPVAVIILDPAYRLAHGQIVKRVKPAKKKPAKKR